MPSLLDSAPDAAALAPLYARHLAELERRYAAALVEAGYDAVVLHAGSQRAWTLFDDNFFPLKVNAPFAHWLPLAHPDCALVVRPGARPRLVWPVSGSFWERPSLPEAEHFWPHFDVVEVKGPRAAAAELPPRDGRLAFVGDTHVALDWGFAPGDVNAPRLVKPLDRARVVKTDYEVACLAEANRRAIVGHRAVRDAFRAGGRSELELHLAYLAATAQDDAETPYKNIVAFDENAATLHHVAYNKRALPAKTMLLDAGATYLGYASDITRTYVQGTGAAETAFAQLLDGMERLQQALCAAAAVGRPYESLHDEAHLRLGEVLREVGLVKLSPEEAAAKGVTRTFLPHGLGHSLGLQTHDVGCAEVKPRADNPFLRNTTTIAPGQVFTVEPGVYFIPALMAELEARPEGAAVDWQLVEALTPLGGIRIEDDVLVNPTGPVRNLTRELLA